MALFFKKHSIGKTITELRKAKGWTQVELAKKLQVSDKAVSKWEKDSAFPSVEFFPAIAELFGVSIDYLMTGKKSEESINLDDMDDTKRLMYVIAHDDIDNFKKYKCENKVLAFKAPNFSSFWKEIISKRAHKIFAFSCGEAITVIENELQRYNKSITKQEVRDVFAYYIHTFIDSFIKTCVDLDRSDILESIGFRTFAIRQQSSDVKKKRSAQTEKNPFQIKYDHDITYYINGNDAFLIKEETIEYFFINRAKSPRCFEYITELELKVKTVSYRGETDIYAFTHMQNAIVDLAIKYEQFDVLEKILELFDGELKNESFDIDPRKSTVFPRHYKTYVFTTWGVNQSYVIEGRIFYFTRQMQECLIAKKRFDLFKKVIAHNCKAIEALTKMRLSHDSNDIYIMSNIEYDRLTKLNGHTSEKEKFVYNCTENGIINIDMLLSYNDFKTIKQELFNNPIHEIELIGFLIQKKDMRGLFRYSVDNNLNNLMTSVLNDILDDEEAYIDEIFKKYWRAFGPNQYKFYYLEKGTRKNIFPEASYGHYGYRRPETMEEALELFSRCKQRIVDEVAKKIDKDTITGDLTLEYFEKLLAKGDIEMLIIKLCVRLESILRCDFHYDGDFSKMIDQYCSTFNSYDDEDYNYDPCTPRLLNKLRMKRNSIVHSVKCDEELSIEELRKCIEHICKIG